MKATFRRKILGTIAVLFLISTALLAFTAAQAAEDLQIAALNVEWSPDGETLAFFARRDGDWEIYVMDIGGTNIRQLTHNQTFDIIPSFSADGERVLYATLAAGSLDIYEVDVAGGEPRPLIASPEFNERDAQEIPGGRIAYVWSDPKIKDRSDIRIFDPATGETEILVSDGYQNTRGAWSPLGNMFAFSSNKSGKDEIYLADWDGSNQRQITFLDPEKYRVGSAWPAFTPDGKTLVYWGDEGGNFMHDHHHIVLDMESGEVTVLPKRILSMAYPGLSPDGKRIVYAASLGGPTPVHIFVMNLDGSEHRTIWPPPE